MENCIGCFFFFLKKTEFWDFANGPVLKNSPSNMVNVGVIPGQGIINKIPHDSGQLSLWPQLEKHGNKDPVQSK